MNASTLAPDIHLIYGRVGSKSWGYVNLTCTDSKTTGRIGGPYLRKDVNLEHNAPVDLAALAALITYKMPADKQAAAAGGGGG